VSEIDDEHAVVKVVSDTRAMRGAFEVMDFIVAHIDTQMSSHLEAHPRLLLARATSSAHEVEVILRWQTARSCHSSARDGSRAGIPKSLRL